MSETLRILIGDDHGVVRDGLALLIEREPDMHVVARARSGREAVQMAQLHAPHVVLLDISMPDLGGVEATEQIQELAPRSLVLVLTRHTDPGYLRRLLAAGARGYVVKKSAGDSLIAAIRSVVAGGTWIDPTMAAMLVPRSAGAPDSRTRKVASRPLSEREEQVLRLIAWGKSNKEVANQLGLSVKTVEFYKASALDKLQLRTRTDVLRYALAERWLADDSEPE